MTIDKICQEMTEEGTFYNSLLTRYFSPSDRPLIISELAVAFLKDRDKMNLIIKDGNFRGYFCRTIYWWTTKTNLKMLLAGETRISQWADQVEDLELEAPTVEDYWDDIEIKLGQINVSFRDAQIFRLVYREHLTYREIRDLHNWSPSTISRSVKITIGKIKASLEQNV